MDVFTCIGLPNPEEKRRDVRTKRECFLYFQHTFCDPNLAAVKLPDDDNSGSRFTPACLTRSRYALQTINKKKTKLY